MKLTIEVSPEHEKLLREWAAAQEVAVEKLALEVWARGIEEWELDEAADVRDAADADRILADPAEREGIPWEQIKAELNLGSAIHR